jgi:hypothetical protein
MKKSNTPQGLGGDEMPTPTTIAELEAALGQVNDIADALDRLRDYYGPGMLGRNRSGPDLRDRMDALLSAIPEYAAIQDDRYMQNLGRDLIADLVWEDGFTLGDTRELVRLGGRVVAVAFDADACDGAGYWSTSRPSAEDVGAAIGNWDGITVRVLWDVIDCDPEAEPWLIRKVVEAAGDACGVPMAEFDGAEDDADGDGPHGAGIRYELPGGGDVAVRWRSHQICPGCGQGVIEDGGDVAFFDGRMRIFPGQHGCGAQMGGPAELWLLDRVDDEADPIESLSAVIRAVWEAGPENEFEDDEDEDDEDEDEDEDDEDEDEDEDEEVSA